MKQHWKYWDKNLKSANELDKKLEGVQKNFQLRLYYYELDVLCLKLVQKEYSDGISVFFHCYFSDSLDRGVTSSISLLTQLR